MTDTTTHTADLGAAIDAALGSVLDDVAESDSGEPGPAAVAPGQDGHDQPSTRPAVASRHAQRPKDSRKVTRFTLDLEAEQHRFLRIWAISQDVQASKIMRCLLFLLEADETLQKRVREELFALDDTETKRG